MNSSGVFDGCSVASLNAPPASVPPAPSAALIGNCEFMKQIFQLLFACPLPLQVAT